MLEAIESVREGITAALGGAGANVGSGNNVGAATGAGAGAGAGGATEVAVGTRGASLPVKTAPFSRLTRLSGAVLPEKNSAAVRDSSDDGAGGYMSDWNESACVQ